MEQNIKIAVIGGTGKAGRFLVKELVNKGFHIRVLTRDPDKFDITHNQIEKIIGDVTNYESVYSLLQGCTSVISTLGQSKGDNPVFSIAAQNIVKAMTQLQIRRYIVLTGLTLDTQFDKKGFSTKFKSSIMKTLFSSIMKDKKNEYEILLASDLEWIIVRVPFIELTESRRRIEVSLTDCPGKRISSTDLACFLIDQLSNSDYVRRAPFISNI
jgi:putative NADH-flavin reductase